MSTNARELRYAVGVGAEGVLRTEDGTPLDPPGGWTPEHLLLAALARCALASLRYHADRLSVELASARAAARGLVTRREEDGRYALVEAGLELNVELAPLPVSDDLEALVAKAERDCFVGASLRVTPSYRWTVNGTVV